MSNTLEQNIKSEYDTKYEQVDASVRFVFQDNAAYYKVLANLPTRVEKALVWMCAHWYGGPVGYHFKVLRAAHYQYSETLGYLSDSEFPFTDEELENPWQLLKHTSTAT